MRRDNAVDFVKAIGILLMILGHCQGIPYLLRNFIFSFHMPLFFIMSGYFYKDKPIKELFKTGSKHLVVPYLITSLFIVLLCFVAQKPVLAQQKMIGILMSNGGWPQEKFGANLPYIGPIWFLLALFWCKIFYRTLKRLTNKCLLVSTLLSSAAFIVGKYILNLPFGLLTGFCGLVFYSMGDYWHNRLQEPIRLVYLLPGIVIWFFCIFRSHLELATFDCMHYPLNMIAAFIGTYMTYQVAQKIPKFLHAIFGWIGRNTLLILCYHSLTPYLLINISKYMLTPLGYSISVPIRWALNFALALGLTALHLLIKETIRKRSAVGI